MKIIQKIGLVIFILGLLLFTLLPFLGTYQLEKETVEANVKDIHSEKMMEVLSPMYGKEYASNFAFISDFKSHFNSYNDALKSNQEWDKVIWDNYAFALTKASSTGPVSENPFLYLGITVLIGVFGALLYILPLYRGQSEGIKNDGKARSQFVQAK
jgi:hypothetical protein